jgi:hypothetical protein
MREPDNKLQKWISAQIVGDEMLWKGAFGHQMMVIRDEIVPLMAAGLVYQESKEIADVIATHTSKSIRLPVVEVTRKDLGLRFTMRQNFYNWKLSVLAERPIEVDFTGLFHTTPPIDKAYTGDPLADCYFEGFPEDRIYRYYSEDPRKFSAEIWGDEPMWTSCFLIMRSVGALKPLTWHTRETHQKAMDERRTREKAWEGTGEARGGEGEKAEVERR